MNQRFLVLDSFRGIAAICVVIFHVQVIGSIAELNFFRGSSLFVEFFFVLSGFVLAHTYGFKDVSFKRFIISRTFRLYPLHLFMFFMFLSLEFVKLAAYKYGFSFETAPFEGSHGIKEIIPNLLFLQSWLPGFNPISWNAPAWSLSVEYYMYIIFFFTLFIKSDFKYIVWFLFSVISFYMIVNSFGIMSEVIRGLSCFFAGALVYLIYKKTNLKFENINTKLFSIIEFLLIFLIIYIISYVEEYKAIYASFTFLVIVFFFAFEKGVLSKILKVSFFQLLGKLSYSIYITHALILWCLGIFVKLLGLFLNKSFEIKIEDVLHIDFGNIFINNFVVFIILFIVIVISMFTYKYIEVKGQEFGKKLLNK
ncbi:acyltransferase [Aliarcobacter skirrowii]|uniref:acyltransferase family protein n=1 Tax=Aliarcobacter skirrowii TaxID=28200 RepID=UPI00320914BE